MYSLKAKIENWCQQLYNPPHEEGIIIYYYILRMSAKAMTEAKSLELVQYKIESYLYHMFINIFIF